ncbi:MAG: methionine--tRNA ligase [Candidatus Pacearchaeota archaeon]|nr:methionine--tRNA ligase [Candidatus Pacearchaeota archaeon]
MAKKSNKFYITTAIDYVNARPHIGHAFEKVLADAIARWQKLNGKQVWFLTGTDENAQKNAQAAKEAGIQTQKFVDQNSKVFIELCEKLNVSYDYFIRTTESKHKKVAQEIFEKVYKKGDIYKGTYEGLYCYGCEAYKTEKDLVNGKCPEHPDKELVCLREEAYFFKLSKYKNQILKFIPKYIIPEIRRNEIIARLKEEELKDLCVSRKGLDWGIDVPFDRKHKIYVWFDALINYISGSDGNWPADLHIIGKGINWFHSVIWPAMLISVGYELPYKLLVHGYLTIAGRKISKSFGKIIDPIELIGKYGTDSVRYSLLRCSVFEDSDYDEEILIERNNKELADKLGNLVSRVSALAEQYGLEKCENKLLKKLKLKAIETYFENYEVDKALALIFEFIDACNLYVQENELWKSHDKKKLFELCDSIKAIVILLWPFMPETSEKIAKLLEFEIKSIKQIEKPLEAKKIKKSEILFKKIESKESKSASKEEKAKETKQEEVKQTKETKKMSNVIPYNEWAKLDLRVGKIVGVKPHPNADKLVLLEIDLGDLGKRTLVAGIKQHYSEKELKGKQCIVFTNLEPKEVRGVKSEGMILAAVNKDKSKVILIAPEKEIEPGSKVE